MRQAVSRSTEWKPGQGSQWKSSWGFRQDPHWGRERSPERPSTRPYPPSCKPQNQLHSSRRALPLWLRWGFLLLAAYLCFGYLTGLVSLVRVNAEIRRVQQEIAALEWENAQLAGRVRYMESPGYVEKVAREELGLVAPGEIRYRVAEPVAPDDPWKKDVEKRPGVEKNTNFY